MNIRNMMMKLGLEFSKKNIIMKEREMGNGKKGSDNYREHGLREEGSHRPRKRTMKL